MAGRVVHLRTAGYMGRKTAGPTYCHMRQRTALRHGLKPIIHNVTDDPAEVTCKRCLAKLGRINPDYISKRLDAMRWSGEL